jgi:SRSO17 transposase
VAVAAGYSVEVGLFDAEFQAVTGQLKDRFCRAEPARNALDLVAGLVAPLERKNCWTIAEHAGHVSPHRLQHLLAKACWDADLVRDDVRDYVVARLLRPGEKGVLVIDETGDLKKGTRTVGVQRQYTGTAGRIENAQVAVYASLVTTRGHALIDRALYLPRSWADDPERRRVAGVPDDVTFATKPALAAAMVEQAVAAGVPISWVTADEVYGNSGNLRGALRQAGLGYVLVVGSNHHLTIPGAGDPDRVDLLALHIPRRDWHQISAGPGSKGERFYSWARLDIEPDPGSGGYHWLLVRRNDTTGEYAYYRCWHPDTTVDLAELARIAGRRWPVEEDFQTAKGNVGLDQHQVRTWDSWHRWTTLAMLAHAFLAVLAATLRDTEGDPQGLIPITVAEARRLLNAITTGLSLTHALACSYWRRRHQYQAQQSHYKRRGHTPPQPQLRL